MSRAWLARALALVIVACGPIDGPPAALAPLNSCPAYPCAAYAPYQPGAVSACSVGVCEVPKALDYVLVVSVPETSFFAPSTAFAIPSSDLFTRPDPAGDCSQSGTKTTHVACARLPDVGVVAGEYVVDPAVASQVNFYLGNGLPQPQTALPVHVTYRPLWPTGTTTFDAAGASGLPLLPVAANLLKANELITGPSGGPVIAFEAVLAPGAYERTVMPDPPYDSAFPADVSVVTVASGAAGLRADLLSKVDTIPDPLNAANRVRPRFNITPEDPTMGLDGGIVYLRDQGSKRRLSTVVTLGPGNRTTMPLVYHVGLETNHHPPASMMDSRGNALFGTELVVVPPGTSLARPSLVVPFVATEIPPDETYPSLPAIAMVSGQITASADSAPAPSDLLVTSTKITQTDPMGRLSTNLAYAARVTTDDRGRYSVPLPPGEFSVIVTPRDTKLAKATPPSLRVEAGVPLQANASFAVDAKSTVRGAALVSDGRPLSGAVVEAVVAASQRTLVAPDAWPRPATTTTLADGSFALELDPGTYDLTVKPSEGSRLPWLVSTSRVVEPSGDLSLPTFLVPAPIAASLVVKDPTLNPIQRAVVRVFARPEPSGQGDAVPPYVEIGRAMTDARGQYEMFLAGPPR